MNFKCEIFKVVSSVLSDLVKSGYFTEWQAGFVFGFLQCKLSDSTYVADDVFAYEDNFKEYRFEKGDKYGFKS